MTCTALTEIGDYPAQRFVQEHLSPFWALRRSARSRNTKAIEPERPDSAVAGLASPVEQSMLKVLCLVMGPVGVGQRSLGR
jgi:hypothetical protein